MYNFFSLTPLANFCLAPSKLWLGSGHERCHIKPTVWPAHFSDSSATYEPDQLLLSSVIQFGANNPSHWCLYTLAVTSPKMPNWQHTGPCSNRSHSSKKVAHIRLPSAELRSWSWFFVVSLQVTRVIHPAVGCHYFPLGPQLSLQTLRGLIPISLLGEQRHDGCEHWTVCLRLLPDSIAAAIWTGPRLCLSPAR